MSVPSRQTVRNCHIITCVFILFTSNEDQKILYIQANEFIYVSLLQEEPEIQEFELQLDCALEGDCKKPGETLIYSQQVREMLCSCFINEHMVKKVLYIQPLIRA